MDQTMQPATCNLQLIQRRCAIVLTSLAAAAATLLAADSGPAQTNRAIQSSNTPPPRADAPVNALRRAPTGHISNYDEDKVGAYTLPDPLVLQNGKPVRDADTWFKQRRPEIINLYETYIYGRVPDRAPKARFE